MRYYVSRFNAMTGDIPREVIAGALAMAVIFGGAVGKINYDRADKQQVAFSEIGKMMKAAERDGKTVGPLTQFYARNSDSSMPVFEAHNISRETNRSVTQFAKELETITDPAYRVHWQMGEYAAVIPGLADRALESLAHLSRAATDLSPAISELKQSWSESHTDVTKTVTTEHEVCDSEGKNCHTETESHEEYDHTVHTYTYYPQHAANADQLVNGFLREHPDLSVTEQLQLSASTDADNEYIIEKSIEAGKMLAQENLLAYANTWATGSNLMTYRDVITGEHANLGAIVPVFSSSRNTARSLTKSTYSRSDDGPREFQVAHKARDHAVTIYESIHKIVDGIAFARDAVPLMDAKIRELIAVSLDGKPGDAKALQAEIMDIARNNYQKNYEKGLDENPFKWEQVLLAALAGAALGGLGGLGVARYRELHP